MDVDLDKYKEVIDAIISTADPDEISPKKIRKCIQELYNVNLNEQKKQFNELIIERFNELQDRPKILVMLSEWEKLNQVQEKYNSGSHGSTVSTKRKSKPNRVKKPSKDGAETNKRGLASATLLLSEKLQNILHEPELPRTQVVKKIWEYIKANSLQNPNDGREILCDSVMEPVFGKKTDIFKLNKTLSDHLMKKDEVIDRTNQ